ncbi:hypothetical protein [Rhizohabitans arisaemae]|uniref:hypothetical protein n=1 Tax=Rhizohabitans arisaemae TaxID=2720610 RepID=UPI0024B1C9EB|nr:hypothetical protein [Rhizohabitans arisaemae]
MTTQRIAAATVAMLTGVTLLAGPAAASTAAAPAKAESASAAAPQSIPCRGGYVRMASPWRSGSSIKVSTIAHCDTVPWSRVGYIEVNLDQYRGVGIWRNKARKSYSVRARGFTVTLQPTWRCSGGNQLYRNQTKGWIVEDRRRDFKRTVPNRRISC